MPPGSRKRKAAKKKKEQEASHNQNHNQQPQSTDIHPHDNDYLKHPDDKESEGEEVSSPASQDHPDHQHQFNDVEKEDVEKTEDSSNVQLSSEESKFTEEHKDNGGAVEKATVEETVLEIEMELNPAGELNPNDIIAEPVEPQKESCAGVVPQSLDEESVVEIERELRLFEKLDSKNASVEHVETQKKSSDGVLPPSHEDESRVLDETNVVVDNSPFGSSTEAVNSLSEGLIQVPNPVPMGEVYGSVESGSDTVIENFGLSGEKINLDSSHSRDSFATCNVVIIGMEENGKKEMGVLDQNDRNSPILVDSELENKKDEPIVVPNDATGAPYAKNLLTQETEEKLLLSFNAPRDESPSCVNTSDGADHIKESDVHEFSETQPLVASAARPAQRASWMNCCGLFEVFSGSNR